MGMTNTNKYIDAYLGYLPEWYNAGIQTYTDGDLTVPGRNIDTFLTEILPFILELKQQNSIILDIGCGNGRMIQALLPYYTNIIGIEPYKKEYEYDKNIDDYIKDIDLDKYKNDKPKHDIVLMIGFAYMFNNNPSKLYEILNLITNENALIIIGGDPNNTTEVHECFSKMFKLERTIEINKDYYYVLYSK
tara:strand:- start:136 stop:705 length:570 start_codon:yes stop_codon:yes gene_type:complete